MNSKSKELTNYNKTVENVTRIGTSTAVQLFAITRE